MCGSLDSEKDMRETVKETVYVVREKGHYGQNRDVVHCRIQEAIYASWDLGLGLDREVRTISSLTYDQPCSRPLGWRSIKLYVSSLHRDRAITYAKLSDDRQQCAEDPRRVEASSLPA